MDWLEALKAVSSALILETRSELISSPSLSGPCGKRQRSNSARTDESTHEDKRMKGEPRATLGTNFPESNPVHATSFNPPTKQESVSPPKGPRALASTSKICFYCKYFLSANAE